MESIFFFIVFVCGAGHCSVIRTNLWHNPIPMTWQASDAYCQTTGGKLVTFVTQSEIDTAYLDAYYGWIALRLKSGSWSWCDKLTSYPAGVEDFLYEQPGDTNDCGLASYNTDRAVGGICQQRHFFFCKYDSNYRFYIQAKSWDDAFQFCQDTGQSLAIFDSWENLPSGERREYPVWTGLHHDGESWKWQDREHSYWKWAPGFDPGSSSGLCGSVWSHNKSMSVHDCSELYPSLCYFPNVVLVKQNLTWEESWEQCKSVGHRMLSVDQSELIYVNSRAIDAQTDKVWLGLRFLGGYWFWSNGQTVTLSGLPSCPESRIGCGALVLDRSSNGLEPQPTIELKDCSEKLNLLCYWS